MRCVPMDSSVDTVGTDTVITAEAASRGFAAPSGHSVRVVLVAPVSVGPDSGPAPGGRGEVEADLEGGRGAAMCARPSSPC